MYNLVKNIIKRLIKDYYNVKKILWKIHYYLRYKQNVGFVLDKTTNFHKNVRLLFRRKGTVKIEGQTNFQRDSRIVIDGGNLFVGSNCSFGEQNVINVFDNVIIGNSVLTADRVNLISNIHVYSDITVPICEQKTESGPITIGDGTWLGINCTILPFTNIGKNCVVGANSVVKGDFPDYSVIVGAPARIVKQYNKNNNNWDSL